MRLIIAGSRGFSDYELLKQSIIDQGFWKIKQELEVVCGMARGADLLGKQFADRNGLIVHKFPADWDTQGKAAGHIRNKQMGDFADSLLAFWDGSSRGTKHMIEYMQYINKPTIVVMYKE